MNGTVRQNIQYGYDNTSNYQSGRVKTIYNSTTGYTQSYAYHSNGYLSKYTNPQNGDNYTYTYDGAGRLINDGKYAYTYDSLNNIVKRIGAGKSYEYTYWPGSKTRIKSIIENGVESNQFVYDATGNILRYKSSTQNLYWTRGNMLSHGTVQTGKPFTYKYDADNLRYSKTVNGTETIYYWDCGVLLGEKTGSSYTQYLYDASGIIGMIYNGSYYYFEKNLFGDVLRVYNSSGTMVASFTYDSYGNIISQSGSMVDKVNFRYRGYYYDSETGFYYLQTRYYDPSICRFISADQPELLGTLADYPGQINLYAYCNNNPIMYTDETGEAFFLTALVVGLIAGAIIGGTVSTVESISNGETGWELAGSICEGILLGSLAGGAAGALVGIAPTIGASLSAMLSGTAEAGVMAMSAEAYLVAAGATAVLGNVMFSRTSNSNGYWGQKYSNDHAPDHIHFKGTDGTNIRIGRDGKPLNGEILTPQQRKALNKLLKEILGLFN